MIGKAGGTGIDNSELLKKLDEGVAATKRVEDAIVKGMRDQNPGGIPPVMNAQPAARPGP